MKLINESNSDLILSFKNLFDEIIFDNVNLLGRHTFEYDFPQNVLQIDMYNQNKKLLWQGKVPNVFKIPLITNGSSIWHHVANGTIKHIPAIKQRDNHFQKSPPIKEDFTPTKKTQENPTPSNGNGKKVNGGLNLILFFIGLFIFYVLIMGLVMYYHNEKYVKGKCILCGDK
jgi:hypothetical protein